MTGRRLRLGRVVVPLPVLTGCAGVISALTGGAGVISASTGAAGTGGAGDGVRGGEGAADVEIEWLTASVGGAVGGSGSLGSLS